MKKTKIFILTFVITWMSAICLFDYYREDFCSFESEYSTFESEDLPAPIEAVNLSV